MKSKKLTKLPVPSPTTLSNQELSHLLNEVIGAADRLGSNRWELGKRLHEVMYGVDINGRPAFESWGFESYSQFLESIVGSRCGRGAAEASRRVYRTFGQRPEVRNVASDVSFTKLTIMAGVRTVDPNALIDWCTIAARMTTEDVARAVAYGNRTGYAYDPTRCFENRHLKGPRNGLPVRKYKLSKDDNSLLERAERWGQRAGVNKPGAALAACLRQFFNLVDQGKAGQGWNREPVEIKRAS